MKKFGTAFALLMLTFTLGACGNKSMSEVHKENSRTEKEATSNKLKKAKRYMTSKSSSDIESSSLKNNANYSVDNSHQTTGSSVVKQSPNSNEETTMTAVDAKNIVKEHIINKLNTAGINGQPKPSVPSMDEIDGYTAVQNGTNDWTVSGNGHVYHVTATSVTEN